MVKKSTLKSLFASESQELDCKFIKQLIDEVHGVIIKFRTSQHVNERIQYARKAKQMYITGIYV